ncbi:M28 family peptidase [Cytophagaceae bacterium YF14B1]|uniref:M28 family peptidase n=1 Tax=Xanthocytophaga flava TaxID=3048013 RepID=A0AAE3UCB3_9BACT|nr:M28 family peptidase [Xanthocytophaga flavus]MDJ1484549.1 M28 family peptidase [Xanthocytophaga flavus]
MKKTFWRLSICLFVSAGAHTLNAQSLTGFLPSQQAKEQEAEKLFLQKPKPEVYKKHLEALTRLPHSAGTPENAQVRAYIVDVMKKAGWQVEEPAYDIFMPVSPGENTVEIITPEKIKLNTTETPVDAFSGQPRVTGGWNSFSGSGDVTAEVVYANFGTKEDFEKLESMGVSVKGKIVIARYGGNFRGYKAKHAQAHGAAGVIIYTDPIDAGYMKGITYPEGPQANDSYIQRGSLLTVDFTGDPLTPFVPALPLDGKKKIERLSPDKVDLHKIPVTPISYGAAKEILIRMTGQSVPAGWQGALPCAYRIEGGSKLKVHLKVEQKNDFTRVTNVIGTLKGSEFPDEWIILGSHYDAWVHGATDPNSGTSMLISVAEALGELTKAGYRPKRSIKICHWDAEEFGVIGSTEWVEQFKEELSAKAVAYMNADAAVSGKSFGGASSPSLKQLLKDATQMVAYPGSDKTVYQQWAGAKSEPEVGNLGGGSDHIAFYMYVGVPSWGGGTGGVTPYHSAYDNFEYYSRFVDPTFQMGPMVSQIFGIMAMRLANAEVIPYDVSRYATDLEKHLSTIEKTIKVYSPAYSCEKLMTAVHELGKNIETYNAAQQKYIQANKSVKNTTAELNKILISLEKSFIDTQGMAYGKWYQSLYASPDPYSGYASWMLPGFMYEASLKSTANLPQLEARYLKAIQSLNEKVVALTKKLG